MPFIADDEVVNGRFIPDEEATQKEQEEILSRPAIPAALSDVEAGLIKPPEPSISARQPSLTERFRASDVGRRLLGPTEVEREGMINQGANQIGVIPALASVPKYLLTHSSVPPQISQPIKETIEEGFKRTDQPEYVKGLVRGGANVLLDTPLAPFTIGGKLALGLLAYFTEEQIRHLPERARAFRDAINSGNTANAVQLGTEEVVTDLLTALGVKHTAGEAIKTAQDFLNRKAAEIRPIPMPPEAQHGRFIPDETAKAEETKVAYQPRVEGVGEQAAPSPIIEPTEPIQGVQHRPAEEVTIVPEVKAPEGEPLPTPPTEPSISSEAATELRHPILGLTEKQLSLPSLRTLKARDPELWDKVTKYFGVDKPADVARIAKERFEQMRAPKVEPPTPSDALPPAGVTFFGDAQAEYEKWAAQNKPTPPVETPKEATAKEEGNNPLRQWWNPDQYGFVDEMLNRGYTLELASGEKGANPRALSDKGSTYTTLVSPDGKVKLAISRDELYEHNGNVMRGDPSQPLQNGITLEIIHTEPSQRGKGLAAKFMRDVADAADASGTKLFGEVAPVQSLNKRGQKALNKQQLLKWYQGIGFNKQQGSPSLIERNPSSKPPNIGPGAASAEAPKGIAASAREKLEQGGESAFIRIPTELDPELSAKIKGAAGATMPKITSRVRQVGEAGARYISSKIAAPFKSLMFTSKVLASGVDPVKFGAALTEDNLRSIKQSFITDGNVPAANAVHTLIGARNSPFRTEAEYQAFLADPVTQNAVARHKQLWEQEIDPQYKKAQGIDPDVELPSRGLQTEARINLKPILEGERGTRVATAGRGSLLSTFKRKSPFAREARGTGQQYEMSYQDIIANTYAKQLEIANQNHFNRMLVENGLAVIAPKAPMQVAGEAPSRAYPLRHKLILGDGRVFAKNENLYLPKSLEEEYRAAVNVDAPNRIPEVASIISALNKAALVSISEATGHLWNLGYAALNLPKGNLLTDSLLKVTGRLDVIPTIFKALKISGRNNIEQLSQLAEIGALREPMRGLGPGNRVIEWADKTVRLLLDDAYKELARSGVVENTETARREFINQIGQYNKRAQGPLMRTLRDTGIGPFATAGRAFNVLGFRHLTLNPNVRAASVPAALALKANMLGGIIGFFVLRGVLNYMLTGNVNGRPGTRLMDVDTGRDDKNGKPMRVPAGDLLGPGRGLRVTGIGGAVEAKRAGLDNSEQITSAFRQISTAQLSPAWGPAQRFLSTTISGKPTVFAPQTAPTARPDQSQPVLNTLTAIKEANPFLATAADVVQGEGVSPQKLLGRISPLPGMTSEKYEALPEIVKRAKTREYKEWLVHQANKLAPEKRGEWLDKHMEGVEFTLRDIREIRARTRR